MHVDYHVGDITYYRQIAEPSRPIRENILYNIIVSCSYIIIISYYHNNGGNNDNIIYVVYIY